MTSTSLLASILHVKLRVGCKLPVQIKFKVRITAAGTSRIGIGILVVLVVRFASQREKQQLRVSYEPVRTSYADQDQIAATHAGVSAMLLAKQVEVKGNSGAGNSALSYPVCSEDCAYSLILRLSLSMSSRQSRQTSRRRGRRTPRQLSRANTAAATAAAAATALLLGLNGITAMSEVEAAALFHGPLAGGVHGVSVRERTDRRQLLRVLSFSGGANDARPDASTVPPAATTRIAGARHSQGKEGKEGKKVQDEGKNAGAENAPENSNNEPNQAANSKHLDPSQVLPSHTKGGSIVGGLIMALRTHLPPRQIARLAASGCQIGILYVLFRLTWQAVQEAWEEVQEELDGVGGGSGGGGGGVGVQEEHDRVWLDHAGVEAAVEHQAKLMTMQNTDDGLGEGNTNNNGGPNTGKQRARPRGKKYMTSFTTASELARRLRAAGMPMALPPDLDPNVLPNTPNSVQHVLKSLTRTEGRLLSSTLLSPADDANIGAGSADTSISPDANARRDQINELWNSIGGLGNVKDSLLDLVFPLLMNQSGEDSYYGGLLSNPPGVLLYGPPGCGKTMLVKALASTVNARVLCVSPSTLMRKYVGETELQVRALFSLARKIAPTIIFVDEVDGLFRERGSSDMLSETVSRDLKLEFMQLWDGIRTKGSGGNNANEQILVIGATNRPFDVDSGFLRRMPRSFFVGLPDRAARIAVLKTMLKIVPLSPDFDVDVIAKATEFYSPSDLKELLRTAALVPLREARFKALSQSQKEDDKSSEQATASGHMPSSLRPLSTADVLGALSKVAPTQLNQQYVDALSAYASRAGGDGSNSNVINAEGAQEYRRSSRRPYQHPSGYYVHKTDDGSSYLADIGTFSMDGQHPNPSYGESEIDSESDTSSSSDDESEGYGFNGSEGSDVFDDEL